MFNTKFDPDRCIAPSETLREWMEKNGFTAGERLLIQPVASACSMEPECLQRILDGKQRISNVIAAKLATGTGIPAYLWFNLERHFRASLTTDKGSAPPVDSIWLGDPD